MVITETEIRKTKQFRSAVRIALKHTKKRPTLTSNKGEVIASYDKEKQQGGVVNTPGHTTSGLGVA